MKTYKVAIELIESTTDAELEIIKPVQAESEEALEEIVDMMLISYHEQGWSYVYIEVLED